MSDLEQGEEATAPEENNGFMERETNPSSTQCRDKEEENDIPRIDPRRMSVSERATLGSSRNWMAPSYISWIEYIFGRIVHGKEYRTDSPSREATGWAMDSAARAPLNQAGALVGSAIIRFATIEAKCRSPLACDNKVHGLKPSSLLTVTSAVVGIFAALTMPVVGAIVDHTRHRKIIGVVSAVIITLTVGLEIQISEDTWFMVLILEAIGGYSAIVHITAVNAYLPDLAATEQKLAQYSSRINITQYMVQMMFVAFVVISSWLRDATQIETTRTALSTALGVGVVFFSYTWIFLMRKRGPLSKVPDGSNLLTAGFAQVSRTAKKIMTEYRALSWFIASLLWIPSTGAGVILSIVVTFLTVYLDMTVVQVGAANLLLLIGSFPGSMFSGYMMRKTNSLCAYRLGLFFFVIVLMLPTAFLSGPERKKWAYPVAAIWGIAFGWLYPTQRVLYCTLTPRGQDTEVMGIFTFSSQILGWLLPFLFSIMNEKGVDMRYAMAILPAFFGVGALCTLLVGNYGDALAQVGNGGEAGFITRMSETDLPMEERQQEIESSVPTKEDEEYEQSDRDEYKNNDSKR